MTNRIIYPLYFADMVSVDTNLKYAKRKAIRLILISWWVYSFSETNSLFASCRKGQGTACCGSMTIALCIDIANYPRPASCSKNLAVS